MPHTIASSPSPARLEVTSRPSPTTPLPTTPITTTKAAAFAGPPTAQLSCPPSAAPARPVPAATASLPRPVRSVDPSIRRLSTDRGLGDFSWLSRRLPSLHRRPSLVTRIEPAGHAHSPDEASSSPPQAHASAAPSPARPQIADQEPRDGPDNPTAQSVKVLPQTQSAPHPETRSHNPSTPLNATTAPRRLSSDAHSSFRDSFIDHGLRQPSRTSINLEKPVSYPPAQDPARAKDSKMHQTSSRLLRMTDDDRPFTRDFKDLFSTLMVSLPLTPHRVRWQKVDHSFTSEEAMTNLGSLKFSQSNRMPDPKDPSRIVTTTTTTTFSMAKEMARSVCQKFLEARFIESVEGKTDFMSKTAVWQMTPKGMHVLQRFCQRNGINQKHVYEVLDSPRNTMHLVILERELETDKLNHDQATIEVVFRRFVGHEGPNAKANTAQADSDSLNEYATGLVGVKMARERKIGDKIYMNTFTGKASVDWLMDCSTMVDKREAFEMCSLFYEFGLMAPVEVFPNSNRFQPTKSAIYYVTEKGQRIAGWIQSPKSSLNGDAAAAAANRPREGTTRDSNANRMTVIIRDPALRLLFREFLRETHCEENLSFYLDVSEFLGGYKQAKRANQTPKLEVIRETLAAAYSLYNAFLAPGSPCELNIDHSLRTALAARMTRAVGDDDAMVRSLDEVATLFDQAQNSVFKLMASDSVPKFMREPKYASVIRDRNLDAAPTSFTNTSTGLAAS
ncbi:Regulator of G protein signaling [Botryosphaeria dothidea]|uniref:Regulator of G protein signaling n=1 Tax=Botryosphaeria dothidea TaxID=55169 RepID=A0A8H4J6E9_9PEZI|nr:Regulator of G protein signaling [Botryosphaeria dothidea]